MNSKLFYRRILKIVNNYANFFKPFSFSSLNTGSKYFTNSFNPLIRRVSLHAFVISLYQASFVFKQII